MQRYAKMLVVMMLVLSMAVDTALACRMFRRSRGSSACYTRCQPVCNPCPVQCDPCCGEAMMGSADAIFIPDSHTSDRPIAEPPVSPETSKPTLAPSEPTPAKPTPVPDEPLPAPTPEEAVTPEPAPDVPPADPTSVPEPEPAPPVEPAPADEEMPAEDPAVEPIDPAPAPADPADVVPDVAPEEPVPAEAPPAETPAEEVDNLFGEEPAADAPAEKPADEPAAEPADEPVPEPAPADEPVDDLFGDPAAEEAPKAPAEAPAEKPADADVDNLFDSSNGPNRASGITVSDYRKWIDNTGNYRVNARLVVVLNGKVRLFKENGRYTTVPFERLSEADLEFVLQQNQIAATAGSF